MLRRIVAGVFGCTLALALALPPPARAAAAPDPVEQGRRIYEEGLLSDGSPLRATRANGAAVAGAQAACLACHRRSGMGSVEGDIQMLPVTRPYLFPRAGDEPVAVMDLRAQHAMNVRHAPYTDATLATALRQGVNSDGQGMNALMPRYELGDGDMAALAAYLHQLSSAPSPGVDGVTMHLATVIAPGVAPERKKAFLDTLRDAVIGKNGSVMNGGRHMVSAAEIRLRTERHWELDVWELQGAPATWRAQLDERYRAQPVFALLSGLGEGEWQPVHDFCNEDRVPCWFPSVDLPPAGEGFYTLYYQRGVLLEADVLASYLRDLKKGRPQSVVQLIRDDAVGRAAAAQLARALDGSGIGVQTRVLEGAAATALPAALRDIPASATVMFWLRRPDLGALAQLAPRHGSVFFSGRLSGGEHAPIAPAWRARAHLIYPYMLPPARELSLSAFQGWRQLHRLTLVDEPLQAEAFFAAVSFTETQSEMLNNFYRDYLVERAEQELGRREAGKAEQLSRDVAYGRSGASQAERAKIASNRAQMKAHPEIVLRDESTTIYPRLGLAPGQHLASKGAYIVHFTGKGDALEADSSWIAP